MKKLLFMILIIGVVSVYAQDARVAMPGVVRPVRPMMQPKEAPMRPLGSDKDNGDRKYRFKYKGEPGTLGFILREYATQTGRTLIIDPDKVQPQLAKGQVYLESETPLTLTEYLQAIERVLRMHKIVCNL